MLSLAHTLISLPLAVYLDNPFIIFAAAFILHLLSDTFLHWNLYPEYHRSYPVFLIALDICTGLAAAWVILGSTFLTLPVMIAILGGNTPDIIQALWEMQSKEKQQAYPRWFRAFFVFHDKLQLETRNISIGLISQVVLIGLSLFLLMK